MFVIPVDSVKTCVKVLVGSYCKLFVGVAAPVFKLFDSVFPFEMIVRYFNRLPGKSQIRSGIVTVKKKFVVEINRSRCFEFSLQRLRSNDCSLSLYDIGK